MAETLISFIVRFIQIFTEMLTWALFVYVLMSWFSRKRTPFSAWLEKIVKPIIKPFRWARVGMLDFSLIVAFLIIQYGAGILIGILIQLQSTL